MNGEAAAEEILVVRRLSSTVADLDRFVHRREDVLVYVGPVAGTAVYRAMCRG